MTFRAEFTNKDTGASRTEFFEYDYDATALVEPFARSLARQGERMESVVRIPSLHPNAMKLRFQ